MSGIVGLGGVFIRSRDARALATWYEDTLGLALEAHPNGESWYYVFYTRDAWSNDVRENPVFAIEQSAHAPPPRARAPRDERREPYSLGFRVRNLEATLAALRARGVAVDDDRLEWERGRHGWARDPDGNLIEFYEEVLPDDGVSLPDEPS